MSIPTSTVPAVKTFLFNLFTANLVSDGTTSLAVSYGPFGKNTPGDGIMVGDITDRVVAPFAMVGDGESGAFSEAYTVQVVVECFHGAELGATLEARALLLADTCETLLRGDMTLGGLVLWGRPSGSTTSLDWSESGNGLLATVTLGVDCFAVI